MESQNDSTEKIHVTEIGERGEGSSSAQRKEVKEQPILKFPERSNKSRDELERDVQDQTRTIESLREENEKLKREKRIDDIVAEKTLKLLTSLPPVPKNPVKKFSIISKLTKMPSLTIARNQTATVFIALDKKSLSLHDGIAVGYKAVLQAIHIAGGTPVVIGNSAGTLSTNRSLTVSAEARTLSPGFYRLVTHVELSQHLTGSPLMSFALESDPINVY